MATADCHSYRAVMYAPCNDRSASNSIVVSVPRSSNGGNRMPLPHLRSTDSDRHRTTRHRRTRARLWNSAASDQHSDRNTAGRTGSRAAVRASTATAVRRLTTVSA